MNANPDLSTLVAATVFDSVHNIRRASAASITAINTRLMANPGFINAGRTQPEFNTALMQILLILADVGCSPAAAWATYTFTSVSAAGNTASNMAVVVADITINTTVRQYARYYARTVKDVLKRSNRAPALAHKSGMGPTFYYLAFDFADGIPPESLTPEEANALDCAKQVTLFRATRETITNTSNHYHGGSINGRSGGRIESANRLTFG